MNYQIDEQLALPPDEGKHAEGCADAALGCSPNSLETAYLDGYFRQLRERVEQGENLQIWFNSGQRDRPATTSISYEPGYGKYVNFQEDC